MAIHTSCCDFVSPFFGYPLQIIDRGILTMSLENDIKAGEKIELLVDRRGSEERYVSKVETVVTTDTFIITRPMGNEQFALLSPGEIIRVLYFREDGVYYFDARVLERIKYQESVSARVVILSEKYKLQRRNYFRLNMMVPVMMTYTVNEVQYRKKYDTIDISGGGMKIASNSSIDVDTEVETVVMIDGVEDYVIKGRVVRCIPSEKTEGVYEIGIEFMGIHQRIRQSIIEYIFARHREIIKKGFR